jgi:ankyrin repeat protein
MRVGVRILAVAWITLLLPAVLRAAADLRLVEAVKNKDRASVKTLLEQRVDVNAAQADGATALAWAAHWNDLETADLLIRAGAKANAANEYGVTPLFLACNNHSAAMVTKLLEAGANPNAALVRTGETPLMTCARTGNAEAVRALLARGANPAAKETWRGQTALMWAVEQNHLEVARALIEKGADVRARSKGGFAPLLFAARNGNVEFAKLLLGAGADVNESTPDDGTVLVVASASGREEFSIYLLEHGANPNVADSYGYTPLHYAMQKGISGVSSSEDKPGYAVPPNLPGLVKALLARGANPNAQIVMDYPAHARAPFRQTNPISLVGATPYFLAAASGDAGLMRTLVEGGADPNIPLKDGTTPLMVAAGMGRVRDFPEEEMDDVLDAVRLAVELGADVKAANRGGQTALHAAAFNGLDPVVQLLVDKGAPVNAKDRVGQTPWSIAEAISPVVNNQGALRLHKNTADLLLKLGANRLTAQDLTPPRGLVNIRNYADPDDGVKPPARQ